MSVSILRQGIDDETRVRLKSIDVHTCTSTLLSSYSIQTLTRGRMWCDASWERTVSYLRRKSTRIQRLAIGHNLKQSTQGASVTFKTWWHCVYSQTMGRSSSVIVNLQHYDCVLRGQTKCIWRTSGAVLYELRVDMNYPMAAERCMQACWLERCSGLSNEGRRSPKYRGHAKAQGRIALRPRRPCHHSMLPM